MNMEKQDRFEELMQAFLDSEISSEDRKELGEIIKSDPEKARIFAFHARMESSLYKAGEFEEALHADRKSFVHSKTSSSRRVRAPRRRQKLFPVQLRIAAAACLMIALGAYLFNLWQASQTSGLIRARIIEIKGNVKLTRNGNEFQAEKDMDISIGDAIQTDSSGSALFKYIDEETYTRVDYDTEVELREDNGKRILLSKGRIHCRVAPQNKEKPFRIPAPDGSCIEVIGTEFTAVHKEGKTEVDVEKGSIRFSKNTFSKLVSAGDHGETVRWGDWVVVCRKDMLNPLNVHYDFNTPEFPKEIMLSAARKEYIPGKGVNGTGCFKIIPTGNTAALMLEIPVNKLPVKLSFMMNINRPNIPDFASFWSNDKGVAAMQYMHQTPQVQGYTWAEISYYFSESRIEHTINGKPGKTMCFSEREPDALLVLRFHGEVYIDDITIRKARSKDFPDNSKYIEAYKKIISSPHKDIEIIPWLPCPYPGKKVTLTFLQPFNFQTHRSSLKEK